MKSIFVEAAEDQLGNGSFRIRIIQAGLSGNANFYPDSTLEVSVSLFEGVRVFVKSDKEHLQGEGKDVRNLIGRLSNVAFVAGNAPDRGELQADLEFLEPEGPIATKLAAARERGMTDLFGFSIDAVAKAEKGRIGNQPVRVAKEITAVKSVDLIVEPGAGGQILNISDSTGNKTMKTITPDQARSQVEASALPKPAKERLKEAVGNSDTTEDTVREAIKKERAYIAQFSSTGTVRGLGADDLGLPDRSRIQLIEGHDDKISRMLDAFFDPTDGSVTSIRECYLEITGDRNFTGLRRNCDEARLREALATADLSDVLGNAMNRRMVAEYRQPSQFDCWKLAANVVPVHDFRPNERSRFGGYGDIPKVVEGAPYAPLTSPTDEKATYAVEKRGGTETITLEMITNDDVGAVSRIPTNMQRAAKRTLSKFVLDFIKDNPVVYDGKSLFHADHANLGTAALDATSMAAGRLAMKSQTEKDSGEKLGIGPRYLWVPDQIEETAVNLFRRNTENDKTFAQSLTLEVVPVWYWTDANNWAMSADIFDIPGIEIGFLSGNQEPEMFVQDDPRFGSMFSNDQITYKLRHVYGGAVTDYRGWYKAVVA